MRNTTFMLTGGAGRIICAIPALEKYHRLNPNDNFKVIVHGWENLYWNHPMLQQRTFGVGQKGLFDLLIKDNNLVSPEPYFRWAYYNQKKSMAQAFDEEINHTDNHSDLIEPKLYCHKNEIDTARVMIQQALDMKKKKKFVVYQPYGSGIQLVSNKPMDPSARSLDVDAALKLGKLLSQDAVVLYFGPTEYIHPKDDFMLNAKNIPNADLRFYMAMISQCDYFVGCDSVGQHMARAFSKPGTVILGSTFAENISYPDWFKIYKKQGMTVYNPMRISGTDCEFADRLNHDSMTFTDEQLNEIYRTCK